MHTKYIFGAKLFDSPRTSVFRAVRTADARAVVVKLLKAEAADAAARETMEREYEILAGLEIPGVVRALDREIFGAARMLVLEDSGGVALSERPSLEPLAIETCLAIAMEVTRALGALHAAGITHRDINPSNIVATLRKEPPGIVPGSVRLIDFAHATRLTKATMELGAPDQIEGTLAYVSPEQTGRMNRVLDYRSDFYSLGVTLYLLLSGRLPFDAATPLEWIHCHIARTPLPLHKLIPGFPVPLSQIVTKLMAKTAEQRYQSAAGLLWDLEWCVEHPGEHPQQASFVAGSRDLPQRFEIPQRLYGRRGETERVLNAFDRACRGGKIALLMSGQAGCGKTALIHETRKYFLRRNGYFVEGKFDQFRRDPPYSAWIQAFGNLIDQRLGDSQTSLSSWRAEILEAVGPNAGVLTEVIPDLKHIIGTPPPVAALDPEESRHRFRYVFRNFVKTAIRNSPALTVFLDDMQWADAPSLDLLDDLLRDGEMRRILVIAAYRDDEVREDHPLQPLIERRTANGYETEILALQNLLVSDLESLLTDTLGCSPLEAAELAEPLHAKTGGNPFFVHQLLHSLHDQGLIAYDSSAHRWQWDPSTLRLVDAADNVASLTLTRLHQLPAQTVAVLRLGACFGSHFRIDALAALEGDNEPSLLKALSPAIQEGLILSHDKSCKFAHDRIYQAVYSKMENAERSATHARIARHLVQQAGTTGLEDQLFDIVSHYDRGLEAIADGPEKLQIARFHLQAARKAKAAVAFSQALTYAQVAASLLPDDCWQEDPELAFAVTRDHAELCFLTGNHERSETLLLEALANVESPVGQAELHSLLMKLKTMQAEYDEAFARGELALRSLGVELPADLPSQAWDQEMRDIGLNLAQRPLSELPSAADMDVPEMVMAVRLLSTLLPIAYFIDQARYPLLVARAVNLSLRHGPSPESAFCFASLGLILVSKEQYPLAYQFGETAVALSERFGNTAEQCKALQIFANHILIWRQPISGSERLNQEVFELGLRSGELQFAGYSRNNKILNGFYQGVNLFKLLDEMEGFTAFCEGSGNVIATDTLYSVQLAALALTGQTACPTELQSPLFPAVDSFLRHASGNKSHYAVCSFHLHRAWVLYLLGMTERAFADIREAERLVGYMPGSIAVAELLFLGALVRAMLIRGPTDWSQEREPLRLAREKLRMLAESAPENFRHASALVEAESASLDRMDWSSLELYREAIALAARHGFTHHLALAHELLGRRWLDTDEREYARSHLERAAREYAAWGALPKARELADRHRVRLPQKFRETGTRSGIAEPPDMTTVFRVSQTIASEIVLDRLLSTVMDDLVENAGAQKGILILEEDGRWIIAAESQGGDTPRLILQTEHAEDSKRIPQSVINYVMHKREVLVLEDAAGSDPKDRYLSTNDVRSVLCVPVIYQGQLLGILYFENNLATGTFSAQRVRVIELLAAQLGISIAHARLYENLEQKVRERTQALEQLTFTDDLTGLYNRRFFNRSLLQELRRARRDEQFAALTICDVDYFKRYNDTQGHSKGDEALMEIAGVFADAARRASDYAFRLGGEEFGILTTAASPEEAEDFVEEVRRRVEQLMIPHPASECSDYCTASFGLLVIAPTVEIADADLVYNLADQALYRAKDHGRNRVERIDYS